jgi:hypothetical protein
MLGLLSHPQVLQEPYADHAAAVVGPDNRGKYTLASYFPQGQGPVFKVDAKGAVLAELGRTFGAQMKAQVALLAKNKVTETLDLPARPEIVEKRKVSLEKAREASKLKKAKFEIAVHLPPALAAIQDGVHENSQASAAIEDCSPNHTNSFSTEVPCETSQASAAMDPSIVFDFRGTPASVDLD